MWKTQKHFFKLFHAHFKLVPQFSKYLTFPNIKPLFLSLKEYLTPTLCKSYFWANQLENSTRMARLSTDLIGFFEVLLKWLSLKHCMYTSHFSNSKWRPERRAMLWSSAMFVLGKGLNWHGVVVTINSMQISLRHLIRQTDVISSES